MAMFNSAVLTKKGNELLIDAAAGNKIIFTRMIVGCGEYTDAERERSALEKLESLKDVKQEFTFSAYKKVSEQCFMLTAVISNRELVKGYKITEIGICGKISDDAEDFLCSIAVTNSMEESDTFPPYNGLQECQIVQDYYITISPDAEVTVITRGASVLIEDFLAKIEEIKKEFNQKIEALKQSFQDGVNKIYNYLKGLGFTPNPNSPDGICAAIKNIYDKRYSDGRTQGQADVVANPGAYGVSTEIKYFGVHEVHHENSTFPIYTCPADGNYHISIKAICENTHTHNAEGNHINLIFPDQTIVVYEHKHHANGWETTGEYHMENYRVVYDITKYLQAGATISLGLSYSDSSGKYDGNAYLHNVRTIVPLTIN